MGSMSVIIRLQNLPWSANAADIRAYFSGLSIPEGGVHIVGGEQGDAFIAFSTDEDARQAMLLDGGKLKEIKIKLFLSSRTEMLKVIEQARQQAIKLQTLMSNPQSASTGSSQLSAAAGGGAVLAKDETNVGLQEDNDVKIKEKDDGKRDRKERSLSRGRTNSRSKEGGDRQRDRDRSRGRDRRDKERDRRRRDRSRSRDRYRSRRSRSRDRKRREDSKESHRGTKSRDRDEKLDATGKNDSGSWEESSSPPKPHYSQQPGKLPLLPDPPALPQMLMQMQQNGKDPQSLMAAGHHPSLNFGPDQERRHFAGGATAAANQIPPMSGFPTMPALRGREGWPTPLGAPMGATMPMHLDPSAAHLSLQRPPLLMPDMPIGSFPPAAGFPAAPMYPGVHTAEGFDPMWRMMAQTSDPSREQLGTMESENCIEIRGLPLNVSYIDVKKLFDGLSIPSDGIKMINDNHGNRTGIAYVKFNNPAQKASALNQNGKKVRSNIVEVLHLRDDLYRAAVDNFKPEKDAIVKTVDMEIDNGESSDNVWPKENRRDRGRDRKFQDPYRINPNMDYKRPDPRGNRNDRNDRSERPDRDNRSDHRMDRMDHRQDRNNDRMDSRMGGSKMERLLEISNKIALKGLPPQCNERDILDFFSDLGVAPLNINLINDKMGGHTVAEAFCEFECEEEADKAVTKNGQNMGRFIISVKKVSDEQFLRATGQWKAPVPYQHVSSVPPLLPTPLQFPHYRLQDDDDDENSSGPQGPPMSGNRYDHRNTKGGNDRNERGGGGNYNDRYNSNHGGGNMRGGGGRGGEGRGSQRGRSRFGGNNNNNEQLLNNQQIGGGPRRNNSNDSVPGAAAAASGSYIDTDVAENFGKPGCVVALENIHFRADIDEIISLFTDFEVEHEDVIRRFDERGRPTGDARVSLKTPAEAMRAVRQLAYSQLRGRTVKVSLLQ